MAKYTDEQIKRAMQLCINWKRGNCHKCDFDGACLSRERKPLLRSALDLINRQEAEIEKLKTGQETLQKYIAEQNARLEKHTDEMLTAYAKGLSEGGAEAIKEFAERLKEKVRKYNDYDDGGWGMMVYTVKEIDSLLASAFPDGWINGALEFIAHTRANEYFRLEDCENELDNVAINKVGEGE